MYKRVLAAVLLLLTVLLGACGARSQVAGSTSQTIYGYLQEINEQTRTVALDEVELQSGEGGLPFVSNASRAYVLYPLAEKVEYDFADDVGGNDIDSGNSSGSVGSSGAGSGSNGSVGSNGSGSNGTGSASSGSDSSGAGSGGNSSSDNNIGNNSGVGDSSNSGNNASGNNNNNSSIADSGNNNNNSSTADSSNNNGSRGGTSNSNVGYSHESNDYYGGSGEVGGNRGAAFDGGAGQGGQPGNSVSGNTTVGNGSAAGPLSEGTSASGYGYRNVQGGLFSAFSKGPDRLTAYADRYSPLLCRLELEDGQVVSITVCTGANIRKTDGSTAGGAQ